MTVLAPDDTAFAALSDKIPDLGCSSDCLSDDELSNIILGHVIDGSVLASALSNGMEATTLAGTKLTVDLSDGVKFCSQYGGSCATVSAADVMASNGVIH